MRPVKQLFGNVFQPPLQSLVLAMRENSVDCVLDVGANGGQFAIDLRISGYKKEIHSFEPSSTGYSVLEKKSKNDQNWSAYQYGFGNKVERKILKVTSNNGLSSSVLNLSKHKHYFPDAKVLFEEEIQLNTIKNFLEAKSIDASRAMLKLDTQGYEYNILKGAGEYLADFALVYCETSLIQLYEDEKIFEDVFELLTSHSRRLIDVSNGLRLKSGKLLQVDILTDRNKK